MPEWKPLSEAAEIVEANRNTLARWVKAGKLKSKSKQIGNVMAKLVDVDQVKKLVPAGGLKAGRPKKKG